jgi:hypothetical protein
MTKPTLLQSYLNHTDISITPIRDLLTENWHSIPPKHPRHRNPRQYAIGHTAVQSAINLVVSEPTMRNYDRLCEVLYTRLNSRRVANRIAKRIVLNMKGTPFVLAHSVAPGAREFHITMKQESTIWNGRVVRKSDVEYDFVRGCYVPRHGDLEYNANFVVPAGYYGAAAPSDSEYGVELYRAYFSRLPEEDVEVHGRTYLRVQTRRGRVSFLHPDLADDNYVRGKYDGAWALEAIECLQERSSTSMLRGQPDRPSTLPSIGVELELDEITNKSDNAVRDITDSIRRGLNWRACVTAVNDGSLGRAGAEFVTGWGDPELVMQTLENTLTEFDLRSAQHTTTRCGVHIHLSRDFFDGLEHVALVQWVFERKEFREVVEYVAHRYNERYCVAGRSVARYMYPQTGKYRAVNCDHQDTIEFRMFAAPRLVEDMLHYKDLVLAVVEWMRATPRVTTPRSFGKWLATKEEYTRLFRHMEPLFIRLTPTNDAPEQVTLNLGILGIDEAAGWGATPTIAALEDFAVAEEAHTINRLSELALVEGYATYTHAAVLGVHRARRVPVATRDVSYVDTPYPDPIPVAGVIPWEATNES